MDIELFENSINLEGKIYRVLIPVSKYDRISILTDYEYEPGLTYIISNSVGNLKKMALLFEYVSNNRDVILFLPIKRNRMKEKSEKENLSVNKGYNDLVLIHHSYQLNLKLWNKIREKITNKKIIKVNINENEIKKKNRKDFYEEKARALYKENEEYLEVKRRYETLFLIGSRINFEDIAIDFFVYGSLKKYYSLYLSKEIGMLKNGRIIRVFITQSIAIDEYAERVYDDKGNVVKIVYCDEDGNIEDVEVFEYEYGESNKIIKESYIDRDNILICYYEYHLNGNKSKFIHYDFGLFGDKFVKKSITLYDENEKIIESLDYDEKDNEVSRW